jgi:hypothetical protein
VQDAWISPIDIPAAVFVTTWGSHRIGGPLLTSGAWSR